MVDLRTKRCGHPGCTMCATFGVQGSKKAEFCGRHAKTGMVSRKVFPVRGDGGSGGSDGRKRGRDEHVLGAQDPCEATKG